MKRHVLAAVVAIIGAATLTVSAVAAVAPGTYKGSLHLASGAKIPGSPATVTVAGKKVTIKAPKFADQVQGAQRQIRHAIGSDQVHVQGDDQRRRGERQLHPAARRDRRVLHREGHLLARKEVVHREIVVVGRVPGHSTIKAKKA